MPKRNRTRERNRTVVSAGRVEPEITEQERAARMFVASVKAHDAADRVERQRAKEAAARAEQLAGLHAAKEAAAATIKRLRANGAPAARRLEAEAAYRVAAAELQEFETGERPTWAPTKPADESAVEGVDNGSADDQDSLDTDESAPAQ